MAAEPATAAIRRSSIFSKPKEPTPVAKTKAKTAIEEAEANLARLRSDLATTVAEQLRVEKEQGVHNVPDAVLGSKVKLQALIEQAERDSVIAHSRQAQANYGARKDEWFEVQRQRCMTILALRATNRQIEEMRRTFMSGGQLAELPAYTSGDFASWSYALLGSRKEPGVSGLRAQAYLQHCIAEGIITERDLKSDD